MNFELHDEESAPVASQLLLTTAKNALGFVPNLYAVLAESPAALGAYQAISKALAKSHLSPTEVHLVAITVSAESGCNYCVAAHSALAGHAGVDKAVLSEIRAQGPLSDPKLEALRRLTRILHGQQGWVPEGEIEVFLAAGYQRRDLLDVITVLALKTLSNYTNHLAETPLDDQFAAQVWLPQKAGRMESS